VEAERAGRAPWTSGGLRAKKLGMRVSRGIFLFTCLSACASHPARPLTSTVATPPAPSEEPSPGKLAYKAVPLPGATAPASLDYLAFEAARSRVWVPAGGTGSVDIYDTKSGTFARVDGFKTAERTYKGRTRAVGPSAVSIGQGVAYVGNRATSEVCPIDTETLAIGACLKLSSPTDGVAYVASSKEVWVTTPRDQSIAVLDAISPRSLKLKATIHLSGAPEGYAVDAERGLFFTNLEDGNETVVIDVSKRAPRATWKLTCDATGPRGIATDARGFVYVACTDRVLVLDGTHDGVKLAELETGAGVDNIDWFEPKHLLYVAAAKAARITIARVDDKGQATLFAAGESTEGARNGVVDASGDVYVADPMNARLLVFALPAAP
jgi:DNA-binding beta-propeller fold protein YncE